MEATSPKFHKRLKIKPTPIKDIEDLVKKPKQLKIDPQYPIDQPYVSGETDSPHLKNITDLEIPLNIFDGSIYKRFAILNEDDNTDFEDRLLDFISFRWFGRMAAAFPNFTSEGLTDDMTYGFKLPYIEKFEFQNWWVNSEVELLKKRLKRYPPEEYKNLYCFKILIPIEEVLVKPLSEKHKKFFKNPKYGLPFEIATKSKVILNQVINQKLLLREGTVFFSGSDISQILPFAYQAVLEDQIKKESDYWKNAWEQSHPSQAERLLVESGNFESYDCVWMRRKYKSWYDNAAKGGVFNRIFYMFMIALHSKKQITKQPFSYGKMEIEELPLNPDLLPQCMKQIYDSMKQNINVKNGGRYQFASFLASCKVDKTSIEKLFPTSFDLKHYYKQNRTCHNCSTLMTDTAFKSGVCGCPFYKGPCGVERAKIDCADFHKLKELPNNPMQIYFRKD